MNASNAGTVRAAKQVARALGCATPSTARPLSALPLQNCPPGEQPAERDYTFDYARQPSKAMLKYRKAFLRNDGARYQAFLEQVRAGETRLNTGTL